MTSRVVIRSLPTIALALIFSSCSLFYTLFPRVQPNMKINQTTSYYNLLQTKLLSPSGSPDARTFFSLHNDGVEDFLSVNESGTQTPTDVQYFSNDGSGNFTADNSVFEGTVPALVHARKAITIDVNNDGYQDVVVTGHGYDQPPYPGEVPILITNDGGKGLTWKYLPLSAGFYHSVTAGDINNDGYPDLFFTNSTGASVFLINDGKGGFSADSSLFPSSLTGQSYFTSELWDINGDGYLDLIIAGHEMDGAKSLILWGSASGKYTLSDSSVLPAVPGYGVVIGISLADVNGDGKTDILLNRTGDNSGPGFYQGYYLQLIDGASLKDITSSTIRNNFSSTANWVDWFRFFDVNGDGAIDITTDDSGGSLHWLNDGTGHFG